MKKTIENVIKVLSLRANEDCKFNIYDEDEYDIQVAFESTSVPLVYDVRTILSAFFSNAYEIMHTDEFFGFTEIYLSDGEFKKGKVDMTTLEFCIPQHNLAALKKIK